MTRGRLIAFEGIDQSGKRTQAMLLARRLVRNGYPASVWDFPDYRTPVGKQLRTYLAGRNQLDYHAVHLLYAANKWERAQELNRLIGHGHNVIVNRYSPSNLAYGVAHGLRLAWLKSLENGLPKPDLVLVLRIAPPTSFGRKREKRDIHEGDRQYLREVGNAYSRLATRYGWKIIDGENDPKTVHLEVWKLVTRLMRIKSVPR
ncbi:MAG: dTMP kinase [Candidatus Bathyarchaeia archaeon]